MTPVNVPHEEAVRNIVLCIILTILTCGLYNIYWNAKQMKTLNGLIGRDEFSFWTWLLVGLITCGIFHIYYEYRMGRAVIEIQEAYGLRVDNQLHIISLILSIFALSIVADAIHQAEINKVYENLPYQA